jgi:hypothetical protein
VNIKIFYHWNDEKLIGQKVGPLSTDELVILGAFDPDSIIMNDYDLHEVTRDFKLVNSSTGEVKQSIRYNGRAFIMGMDLRHFPFDAQNLKVILRPQRYTKDDVILKYLSEESAMDSLPENERTSKWYHTDPKMSSANKVYSCLHIIVFTRREYLWFVNNVMISSFVLASVTCATFAIEVGRMELTMLALLASIENKYSMWQEKDFLKCHIEH